MRIAQVAPLYESVPPKWYGGTERVVSYLTEELVRQGHDVTLFASGDSVTQAKLVPVCPEALRLSKTVVDQLAPHVLMVEEVYRQADEFDVVHFHIDYLHYPLSRRIGKPHVTTLHGRLDIPELSPLYQEFSDMPVISISDDQRKPLPQANWQATVYHGLPLDLYRFQETPQDYVAFLGRISPEKRVDRAIQIALRAGMKIKIAAKISNDDKIYFKQEIEHWFSHPLVEFIGEIGEKEKSDFLGNACACLFPIDWPEPFGLVMIESMACGTPVVACGRGSVPEVIDDGETGYIIHNVAEGVAALERACRLDRRACRTIFEKRFSAERMALDYLNIYDRLIEQKEVSGNGTYHSSRKRIPALVSGNGHNGLDPVLAIKPRRRRRARSSLVRSA